MRAVLRTRADEEAAAAGHGSKLCEKLSLRMYSPKLSQLDGDDDMVIAGAFILTECAE